MSFVDELRRRWWVVLLLGVALLALFGSRLATFYTDVLWFRSIGYVDVFWGVLTTRLGLGTVAGAVMAAIVTGNLLLARRLAPRYRMPSQQEQVVERYRELVDPYAGPLLITVGLIAGVLSGLAIVGEWQTYLLWANAVEFGRTDPQFGRDLGFFVFVLPFHTLVRSWLFTSLTFTIIMVGVAHYVFGGIRPQSPGQKISPQANVHLSILLAAIIAVRAWGFWLDRYLLSYSTRGSVTGLSYTDANAQLIAYQLLTVIAAVCVVLFLLNIRFRNYLLPAAGVAILLVAAVLSGIYPAVIQRLQVDPQELAREREYIARNLELTRFAFGLETGEDVVYQPFAADAEISRAEVLANAGTLESIRLWDPATLQNTFQQLQELRAYYDFRDVDVDRYDIDGQQLQTLVAVREISERDLPSSTWQNQRLVYTHGYGVVATRASVKTPGGQPVFLARDIPAQGEEVFNLENPRVYFGENPPQYSIVDTNEQELDFPQPQGDPATNTYAGEAGVEVGSPLSRLAFALRYAEPNFVLSNLITDESKVLFKRQIRERAEEVAPFLKFDHDPYPVAVDGRIKWVQDAYTTSNMVPYSERVNMGELTLAEQRQLVPFQDAQGNIALREEVRELPGIQGEANYIRNSVKVVIDAYDGTVQLFVVDEDDPVLQAWGNAFPGILVPMEEASEELISHFRYPEDMFRIQSELFLTYHIQDPEQFYTREDAWRTPNDPPFFANQANAAQQRTDRPLRPYYLTLRLPGEDSEEFVLFQPFTPVGENRNNLIAFMAGRSDPEHYGELRAYLMPANELVIGPEQAQALINQDDAVAQQITLWNQSGSRVIYGNLLVVPVGEALIYAQPLFLRAEQSDIPELQRVVLVYGDDVVMEDTLAGSVAALFGAAPEGLVEDDGTGAPPGDPGAVPEGAPQDVDPRVASLIMQALERYAEAEEALQAGDLGAYQEANEAAQNLLESAAALDDGGGAEPAGDDEAAPAIPAPASPAP